MKALSPEVLIIGGGIGGICAALELAQTGVLVALIEKTPAIGGILNQLDFQFPNDHCGICKMLPMVDRDAGSSFCLRKGTFHDNLTILTSTRLVSVQGNPGNYTVSISQRPGGVDPERCSGCGNCLAVCPVSVPDVFNGRLCLRKAICFPTPTRVPAVPVIDCELCTKCNACVDACPEEAITLDMAANDIVLGGIQKIIVATGTALADPLEFDVYGYGILPHVLTATAFERMVSQSGPYEGKAVRLSDGKPIRRIAWIQCVGSRNVMIGADHCSSACCMFAVKQALLAKEKIGPDTETVIFYMDMRTFGRDFQRYRDHAENDIGVKFVRCRIHSVEPGDIPGDVKLTWVDDSGKAVEGIFDVAVLSTGQKPGDQMNSLDMDALQGIDVEILDSARGLKDIAATIVSSLRLACRVGQNIKLKAAGFQTRELETPSARSDALFRQRPRIAVALCHDEPDASSGVDWRQVESDVKALPGDLVVFHSPVKCSENGWRAILAPVTESMCNRLVLVTRNSYRLWPQIKDLYRIVGMNASQVEIVSPDPFMLRDLKDAKPQDHIVQSITMAINRLRTRKPATGHSVSVFGSALLLGGGPAGLSSALALADRNISVVLVEKNNELGGNYRHIVDPDACAAIVSLMERAKASPHIQVHSGAELVRHGGSPGRFHGVIRLFSGDEIGIDHGALILATGGGPAIPAEYGTGLHPGIITGFEFERRLRDPELKESPIKTLVMIQCVGSREEPNNYCSRICCIKAVKNAIAVKEIFPEADVYVFYRDIMTYGESERLYTLARKKGVLFIPFGMNAKPLVSILEGEIVVEAMDSVLGNPLRLTPDILALSTGVVPHDVTEIQSAVGFDLTRDGFIQEADSKWRPVDTNREGIFVCGLARNPVNLDEAMAEGEAAAQRALRLLLKKTLAPQSTAARIRNSLCSRCGLCIETCAYGARYPDRETGQILVDPAACQGCGACAAICPNSATVMGDYEDNGMMAAIEAALD